MLFSSLYLSLKSLISQYTNMAPKMPGDRPVPIRGITSRMTGADATGSPFFDGMPVECFVPSLLWRWKHGRGIRPTQNITTSGDKIRILAECRVNTLSWALVEGAVAFTYKWPFCSAASLENIVTSEVDSGDLILQKRTQIIDLYHHDRSSGTAGYLGDNGLEHAIVADTTRFRTEPDRSFYWPYRYCTRLVSLTRTLHSPSRVILEGPTFSSTTETTREGNVASKSFWRTYWNHPLKKTPVELFSRGLMVSDLMCLRVAPVGLTMQATYLIVVEWTDAEDGGAKDMDGEHPESWEPKSAAGIVLIRSEDGEGSREGKRDRVERGEEVYTRIGYCDLRESDPDVPPYRPIRKEAEVRRVTVI